MAQKDYLDGFLSDLEKVKLQQFADDDEMKEAVRKVLLAGLYENGTLKKGSKANPTINFALGFVSNQNSLPDEQIGRQLRAAWEGIQTLEIAFSNIGKFKRDEQPPANRTNKAR